MPEPDATAAAGAQGAGASSAGEAGGGGTASPDERGNMQRLNALRQQSSDSEKPAADAAEGESGNGGISIGKVIMRAILPVSVEDGKVSSWLVNAIFNGFSEEDIATSFLATIFHSSWWILALILLILLLVLGVSGMVVTFIPWM